ncbi:alanine/glycine:cation symporter family protein [Streptococcus himalayensis]|uniref:Sodium:alanine symporter n=1 Tax=Streptococcus himalayensis TaxID=1888195 RepID=A0A917EE26_9STRE|nr:alanine/glycine:cation symporter family protein [Streptococcus himalayensis]GGE28289.1 sodium:alanine symporter [Streptococcus himalayensis]
MSVITSLTNFIWSPLLLGVLIVAGTYFTFRMKFVQVRMIPEMIRCMFEKSDEDDEGISSFQALTVALSGRVGTGNITGVATAIALGGPGSIFWMWLIAFIGSGSAFVETVLGQLFKERKESGFIGGPAYYIEHGLKNKTFATIMAFIMMISSAFLMSGVQTNGISAAMENALNIPPLWTSIVVSLALFVIIIGGISRIAKFAEYVVPFMAGVYILMALIVIVLDFDRVLPTFQLIFASAFGWEPLFAGIVGSAIMYGVRRGVYSNEAGQGSQVAAAASAQVSHPIKQGLVQAFSVYIDTWFVCTATALIILLTGSYNVYDAAKQPIVENLMNITPENAGALYTQTALSHIMGPFGSIFVAVALVFFAFTTLMSYYYIAHTNLLYLLKEKVKPIHILILQILMIAGLFYSGIASSEFVWALGDLAIGFTVWGNIVAIFLLSPLVFTLLKDYEKQLKAGKDPVFDPRNLEITASEYWYNR